MPRSANQKLKLLTLLKILSQETDEEHGLTVPEIIERLAAAGIGAERKSLYQDFEELRAFGQDVIAEKRGHDTVYYLGAREFELPELKLLVDSVQASRFITDRKSRALIRKLEGLTSVHRARQLHRQVFISGRVKTMNESIYYNVDKVHEAINQDEQIRFQYFNWTVSGEMQLRREGAWYQVSPWCLTWYDENYYLVGYDAASDRIKHYRVDKMLRISGTGERREGRQRFRQFDMASYARGLFGMFGGETVTVSFEAENCMAGILIDRFGKDIWMSPIDGEHFAARAEVSVSPQFFGWVVALGDGIRVTAPESVLSQMRQEIRRLNAQYLSGEK